tara:strand:- start:618 stop:758 length:141 start_codon:yes stop_codon:yes gene_type:complete
MLAQNSLVWQLVVEASPEVWVTTPQAGEMDKVLQVILEAQAENQEK